MKPTSDQGKKRKEGQPERNEPSKKVKTLKKPSDKTSFGTDKKNRIFTEIRKIVKEATDRANFTKPPFDVVESGSEKGRVCVALETIQPGTIILTEQAFEYATNKVGCIECNEVHLEDDCPILNKTYAYITEFPDWNKGEDITIYDLFDLLREFCLDEENEEVFDVFETQDRVACFVKCLAHFHKKPSDFDVVFSLTAANLEDCLEAIVAVKEKFPMIFPKVLEDEKAALLLGILNTNSHELDHLGGSGLFLAALMVEHDCDPNCSFTTFDKKLWLTAVKEINPGDGLSVDYGNNFYRPRDERRNDLEDRYGFVCECDTCQGTDMCRVFSCTRCCDSEKIDFLINFGKICEVNEKWKCLDCGYSPNEKIIEKMKNSEIFLAENFPLTLQELEKTLLEHKLIHPSHYLVFWALHGIVTSLELITEEERKTSRKVWEILVKLLENNLPKYHHEKVIFYDRLAQAYILNGNLKESSECYKKAFEMSCVVSGKEMPATNEIRKLMENPPKSKKELLERYEGKK